MDRAKAESVPRLREDLEIDLEARVGHPKGTLLIVGLYGALFALGWLALFFLEFLPRGAPQP
ncbi:MAG: hypothetical protein AAF604_07210 [Acidobacteriota bacterium]